MQDDRKARAIAKSFLTLFSPNRSTPNVLSDRLDTAGSLPAAYLGTICHWISRRYSCSTLRTVVSEIRNFPRRLVAIRQRPHLRLGPSIPLYPTLDYKESRGQGYEFECSCIANIQRLQTDNRWAGPLDIELAAESYQAGANWAIHNFRRESSNTQ